MSPVSGTQLQSLTFLRNEGQLLRMKDIRETRMPPILSFKSDHHAESLGHNKILFSGS